MTESARPPESRGTRFERRIEVAASASTIWALLADVDRWSQWNPLYAAASGSLVPGATLKLSVVLPGIKPQAGDATVKWVVPEIGLQYLTVAMGGLIQSNRYVLIEPAGEGRSTVINVEMMGGLASVLMAPMMGGKLVPALDGMNAALKAEAEKA